ncbi:uncharacterized protein LOC128675589 [Plodia interpunctella]|uniref:uncharacterized protein LOC128675589 n=1 Tax=Plodia interpunctella TaxID=58824 RepID=UPI002368D5C5|nr:uncharacterized protein LOC128675589 [Plodia interpunctella]
MEKVFVFLLCVVGIYDCVLLRRKCPRREIHVACSFHDESTCWQNDQKTLRIYSVPQKLLHCKSGCFCKKSYVRSYPGGDCILATLCRDRRLLRIIMHLPKEFPELRQY